MPTTVEIFCCYAREDQDLMKSLRKHLMPLQRRGLITIGSDTDIDAGTAWEEESKEHLDSAQIILRPTAWKGAPFDKLQMLPSNARPVTDRRSWQDADEALKDVIQHIDPIVTELLLPLYINEAEELVKKGRRADALAIYERALRLEPQYIAALYGARGALPARSLRRELSSI